MNSCLRAKCDARLSALQKRRGGEGGRAEQGREDDSERITDRATVRKEEIGEQRRWAKTNLRLSGHFIGKGCGLGATLPITALYSRYIQEIVNKEMIMLRKLTVDI